MGVESFFLVFFGRQLFLFFLSFSFSFSFSFFSFNPPKLTW